MFDAIHNLLYDGRYIVLVLTILPMLWSLWVFWSVLFVPSTQEQAKSQTKQRHSHRMRAQQKASTKTAPPVAVAEPLSDEGSQSNLLDALAADEEDDDGVPSAGFSNASTIKQKVDDDVVNKLVDDVTDKVAAQIEALTGEPLDNGSQPDIQDMLETVQEDSQPLTAVSDIHDLTETVQEDGSDIDAVEVEEEENRPEGDHTRALRKASKMEEIGFHRPSEDDDDVEYSVLNSPEIADLGAKHIKRITELGLNDGVEADKERLRTAQLDDILSRLDNVLENPESESIADSFSHASTQEMPAITDEEMQTDAAISEAVEQQQGSDTEHETQRDTNGFPIADVEPASQVETAKSDAIDRSDVEEDYDVQEVDEEADEEAADFFSNVDEGAAAIVDPDDVTVREESDHGEDDEYRNQATINADLDEDKNDDDDSFNMSDISAAIESNLQNVDEQDQLDTVRVDSDAPEPSDDEQDVIETIAVSNDGSEIDPNMETLKVDDDDDDLPAWARADSFDEDVDDDDESPKQQNLFDN